MRAKKNNADRLVGRVMITHVRVHRTYLCAEGAAPDQTMSNRSLYGNTHEIMRVMHIIALELARNENVALCVRANLRPKSSNRNKTVWNYGEKDDKKTRQLYFSDRYKKNNWKAHENGSIDFFQIGYALGNRKPPEITYHGELTMCIGIWKFMVYQFGQPNSMLCSLCSTLI